jgi:hypothetical protein
VHDAGYIRREHARNARSSCANTEVDVLTEERQALVERAELEQQVAASHETGGREPTGGQPTVEAPWLAPLAERSR